jgi:hypothetical protein
MPAVYSLAGVGIGGWIARRSQHRQWAHDNKAREYRELLDALDVCVIAVRTARPSAASPFSAASSAVSQASRIFANRIFISPTLKKNDLMKKWAELRRFMLSEPGESPDGDYTVVSLAHRAGSLSDRIMEAAQRDLGLK